MLKHIKNSLSEAQDALTRLMADEAVLANIASAAAIFIKTLDGGGRIFSCGNGGSMCDAMHFAEELTGRFRRDRKGLAAVAISDPGYLSCVANDFGYEAVFSRYLESHGRRGDSLLAASTSGASPTVSKAAETAASKGIQVVALTGRPGSNLEALATVSICTAGGRFADRVQELHIKVIHILIELIERRFYPENYR